MNLQQAEDVVLVIRVHQGEVRPLDPALPQYSILYCDCLMVPLPISFSDNSQSGLHSRRARIVVQLPGRACCRVIPDDGDRDDLGITAL